MALEKEFPPDGRVENEIQQLINYGHSVDMVCLTKKETHVDNYMGGKLYKFHFTKFMYKISALALDLPVYFNFWCRNIEKVLKTERYDVLHIHDLPLIEVGLRIRRKHKLKLVADFHENRPEIMKYYPYLKVFPAKHIISLKKWHHYQERVSPVVDRLVLVTPEAKKYYIDKFGVDPGKIFVVANYANIDAFSKIVIDEEIVKSVKDKFCITYFGDTGVRRGTIDLIRVAAELKKYDNILFYIIGDSTEQHILEKEIKKLKLNNIILTGYMPFNKASSYLLGSKLGICPFHRNVHHDTTYANKMFQYLFYGLPVIVSDCPSQEAIVDTNEIGIVFNAGNVDTLKNAILTLYKNPEKREQMGIRGRELVMEKYNWENAGKELKKLYHSL